jgi:cyclophilin family peptidyl-prolyl cis-trans isomerase
MSAMNDPAIQACDDFIREKRIDTAKSGWRTAVQKPPNLPFDGKRSYFWNIETSVGAIKVKLMPSVAPMHASSTVYLAKIGFYDGLRFHRVIDGFMAQGGCPLGTGTGGPGYKYDGEFDKSVRHNKPGLLSMANAGPGTDGSQFFLTFVPTPHLDGKHTIFGEIVEGMDALKALEKRGSRSGAPSEPLMMKKTTIEVQ